MSDEDDQEHSRSRSFRRRQNQEQFQAPPNVDDRAANQKRQRIPRSANESSESALQREKRARDASDMEVADNPDPSARDRGVKTSDDWNYMPTPDASGMVSDTVTLESDRDMSAMIGYVNKVDNCAALEFIGEVERRIISMALLSVDVTEVYSPERVAAVCSKFGLTQGSSMDLTTGWDFDTQADRSRAEKRINEEKPMLLIGSPPCTYMSILQELNKCINKDNQEWLDRFELNRQGAIRHIEFCVRLYRMQMEAGRYFLHEHPWTAKSWDLTSMTKLLGDSRDIFSGFR